MNSDSRKLLLVVLIVAFAAACAGAFKWYSNWEAAHQRVEGSEAKVGERFIEVADDYCGYWLSNSPEMQKQLARRGLTLNFRNDKGDYKQRLEDFADGKSDIIMLPVAEYLLHGQKHGYPGVIFGAVCESRGADAILGFTDLLPGKGKIQDLNDASLKIVYAKDTPSRFLLDVTTANFDLDNLTKTDAWRQEVGSPDEVYDRAQRHAGNIFVMWEPYVSRALTNIPGLKMISSSKDCKGYIIDVMVVRRKLLSSRFAELQSFLESYFATLRAYKGDRNVRIVEEMSRDYLDMKPAEIKKLLDEKRIVWFDLRDNCSKLFGIKVVNQDGEDGLLKAIRQCTKILIHSGRLKEDPLGGQPASIIHAELLRQLLAASTQQDVGGVSEQRIFAKLSDEEWKKLDEIGTMKVEPIGFNQGSSILDEDGMAQVDKFAELLKTNYPDHRVVIRGHTAPGNNDEAERDNLVLSKQRAEAVVEHLVKVRKLPSERFRTEGLGSSKPLKQRDDEGDRDFNYRLARVEFVLYKDIE